MKFFKTFSALCIAIIMAMAVSACAPTAKSEGTGGYLDDTVVTTKVKAALLGEKNLKSTEINVETFKGRVQLSGFVSSSPGCESGRTSHPLGTGCKVSQ